MMKKVLTIFLINSCLVGLGNAANRPVFSENTDALHAYKAASLNLAAIDKLQFWSASGKAASINWSNDENAIVLSCNFAKGATRSDAVVDLTSESMDCQGISFEIRVDDPAAIRSMMVYVYQGNIPVPLAAGMNVVTNKWQKIVVPAELLTRGLKKTLSRPRSLRIAFWSSSDKLTTEAYFRNVELFNGVKATNLQLNGSFENADELDGWPMGWGTEHWGVTGLPWLLRKDGLAKRMFRDSSEAVHGKYSMRFVGKGKGLPETNGRETLLTGNAINRLKGKLTLSCYMKSDRPMEVELTYGSSGKNPGIAQTFKVSRQWQRYQFTFELKKADVKGVTFAPLQDGVLWVDAVQLERGSKATPFVTHIKDHLRLSSVSKGLHEKPEVLEELPPKLGAKRPIIKLTDDGGILINGKPFIPFGITDGSLLLNKEIPEFYARRNFNCIVKIIEHKKVSVLEMKRLFDEYAKNGIYVIPWFYGNIPTKDMLSLVESLKDHSAILAWYAYDEPHPKTTNKVLDERIKAIQAIDKTRPVIVNYADEKVWFGGKTALRTSIPGDIVSFDYYPVSCNESIVSTQEDFEELVAKAQGRPAMVYLQTAGNAYTWAREPTPAEAYVQCYGALVAGVRAFFYFSDRPIHQSLWEAEKALAYEIQRLAPAIVLGEKYKKSFNLKHRSIIQTATVYQGKLYIVAVNLSSKAVKKVRFSVGEQSNMEDATVWFENRKVKLGNGVLQDDFGPFERHVYVMSLK